MERRKRREKKSPNKIIQSAITDGVGHTRDINNNKMENRESESEIDSRLIVH